VRADSWPSPLGELHRSKAQYRGPRVSRKGSVKREREAQLAQAKENLAKLTDEVELAVHTAYNKLERMQQMLKVSEEVAALRSESNSVLQQELLQGAALRSQAAMETAQEYDAKALLLQS
jgi:hypothetical protein